MQYYDFADIAEDAARKFAEFLSVRFPTSPPAVITDEIRDEVRRRANSIASSALNEDEHLLAFALAAPSTHTVVVKFKDNVTVSLSVFYCLLLLFSSSMSKYEVEEVGRAKPW